MRINNSDYILAPIEIFTIGSILLQRYLPIAVGILGSLRKHNAEMIMSSNPDTILLICQGLRVIKFNAVSKNKILSIIRLIGFWSPNDRNF